MFVISKIIFFLSFFYFFGNIVFNFFLKFKIVDNFKNTFVIKFLISIILINYLIIFGIKLNLIIYLIYFTPLFIIYYFLNNKLYKNKTGIIPNFNDKNLIIVFITLLFFLLKITIEPVQLWDARSIWFFSGKIIYFNDQYLLENFKKDFCEKCIFLFYPKLIPVYASLIAKTIGFWNDYLTKLSLFLILLPSIIFLKNEFKDHLVFLLSLLLIIFSNGFYNWNGYVDGYLSIYCALVYYSLIKFNDTRENIYLYYIIIFSAICINLKIESLFLIISSLIFILVSKNLDIIKKFFSKKFFILILILIFPAIFWIMNNYFYFSNFLSDEKKNSLYFFQYLNDLIEQRNILGGRFNSYLSYVINMTLYDSKILFYFLLTFILMLLNKFYKFMYFSWNRIFLLQVMPLTYLILIILFYLYVGYSYGLPSMKDWILASFDRYTLPVKGILSINLIIIFNSLINIPIKNQKITKDVLH